MLKTVNKLTLIIIIITSMTKVMVDSIYVYGFLLKIFLLEFIFVKFVG